MSRDDANVKQARVRGAGSQQQRKALRVYTQVSPVNQNIVYDVELATEVDVPPRMPGARPTNENMSVARRVNMNSVGGTFWGRR